MSFLSYLGHGVYYSIKRVTKGAANFMWENCGSTGFARASRMCLTRDGPWTRSLDQEETLKLWSKAPGHRRKGDLREEL